MMNKDIKNKNERVEDTWCFPPTPPTEEQDKQIAGRVAEIGVRMVFENFTYRFGGQMYKQSTIGASTMAASRLVMQDWGEIYKSALELSSMELGLLRGYVDYVRQGGY